VPEELARALTQVEMGYRVRLLYGTRRFGAFEHEVLLIDPQGASPEASDDLKFYLWEQHRVDSRRYERYEEYQRYLKAAEPSFAALQAIVSFPLQVPAQSAGRAVMLAHEWLGLPLVFSARRHQPGGYRTVFYAHETATVRPLVEGHPGHDTRFYNAMYAARERGLSLPEVFGDQHANYKHALLLAAAACDGIFAVGDLVVDELRFLSPAYRSRDIPLVYNGVPSERVTSENRERSRQRLQRTIQNLFGFRPTWVFTHVTRMVSSKAMWRDVRVLDQLDSELARRGETAALISLSSAVPAGRRRYVSFSHLSSFIDAGGTDGLRMVSPGPRSKKTRDSSLICRDRANSPAHACRLTTIASSGATHSIATRTLRSGMVMKPAIASTAHASHITTANRLSNFLAIGRTGPTLTMNTIPMSATSRHDRIRSAIPAAIRIKNTPPS